MLGGIHTPKQKDIATQLKVGYNSGLNGVRAHPKNKYKIIVTFVWLYQYSIVHLYCNKQN